MSDLDADLYGDLYGNDDGAFGATDHVKEEPEQEVEPRENVEDPAPASPTDSARDVKPPAPVPPKPLLSSGPPSASTHPAQAQSIPTFEDQTYDGGHRQPNLTPSDTAGLQGGERPIRPSEMKDEGKMFIGGLHWDTTDDTLKTYFEQFGKVDACTIMRDAGGRSRCFAFLTFDDAASVNAVMVREHVLDGKIIDPKRAIPRSEHQRATKLFIGGLAGSVTSESMREFFSQLGKVIDSTVMLDRETGRSKGFGFVSLEDVDVTPYLGFGNLEIDGKLIDVKLAQPRFQRGEEGTGGTGVGAGAGRGNNHNAGGGQTGNYGGQQGTQFGGTQTAGTGNMGGTGGGSTPFDPQALATLYTRMFQLSGGMNPMMGGMGRGMGMGMGGMGGGMMGGGMMGGGMAGGMGGMGGMGMAGMGGNMGGMMGGGGMGMGGGMSMGRGMGGMQGMMGAGVPNAPRGPRGSPANGAPNMGMPQAGVGPQRSQRGQHNYHPYAR